MVKKEKNSFWQAFIFTIIVFSIGLIIGIILENSRTDKVELKILQSEIDLLDQQVRNRGISQFSIDCAISKQSSFDFADRIYQEAIKLEKFDSSSKFTETLNTLHKRYDLLRILLWIEGIEMKESCNQNIHTVVYIFNYATDDINTKATQASLSRLLLDLKNTHQEEILLIPIAGNLDIESVNLILSQYKISELPVILVDEEKLIDKAVTLTELETIVFEKPGFKNLEGPVFQKIDTKQDNTIFLN